MSLIEKVNNDIKTAMLAKEQEKLDAIRSIKAALLLAQSSGEAVTEEAEIKILQKLLKQRKEAAEIYNAQNRKDLEATELLHAGIIQQYLPVAMSEDELKAVIKSIIEKTGASSVKDMGKVMGLATKELAGKAENKTVSEIVRQMLGA